MLLARSLVLLVLLGTLAKGARAQSGDIAWIREGPLTAFALAYSPDGAHLASSHRNGTIRIWNAKTHDLERTLIAWPSDVIVYSPDGRYLITRSRVYDLKTFQPVPAFELDDGYISISPDGTKLAVCDTLTRIREFPSGRLLRTLPGYAPTTASGLWASDSRRIVLTDESPGALSIYDAINGLVVRPMITAEAGKIRAIAWVPGSNRVVASAGSELVMWNAATGDTIRTFQETHGTYQVAASRKYIVTTSGNDDGTVTIRNIDNGSVVTTIDTSWRYTTVGLAISPDENTIATSTTERDIRLWQLRSGMRTATLLEAAGTECPVALSTVFSPDGTRVAVGLALCGHVWPGTVRVFDALTGGHDTSFTFSLEKIVYDVAWSPNGRKVFGSNTLVDYPRDSMFADFGNSSSSGSFSPSSDQIVTGGYVRFSRESAPLKIWSTVIDTPGTRPKLIRTIGSGTTPVWSPDGSYIAYGANDRSIVLCDDLGTTLLTIPEPHPGHIPWRLAWSADGRFLASCGDDSVARVWSIPSCALVATLRGHNNFVLSVGLNRDGRYAVTGGLDGLVKLWEVATQRALYTYSDYPVAQFGVAFSPDEQTIASATENGALIMWRSRFTASPVRDTTRYRCSIALVPNPVSRGSSVAFHTNGNEAGEVGVYDVLGRIAINANRLGTSEYEIDTSGRGCPEVS